MISAKELVEKISVYIPDLDEKKVLFAYEFAQKAHNLQKRASGEPYFSHPLEVALTLCTWKCDLHTVISGLFHDILEDTSISEAEMRSLFGDEITNLVKGVTKVSKIFFHCKIEQQAINFQKLILSIENDLRVLIIKLADRLHNIKTLYFIENKNKKEKIAKETLDFFCPLAEKIGMYSVKNELENYSFYYLFPEMHNIIQKRLFFLKSQISIEKIRYNLEQILSPLLAKVTGRQKTLYSIWQKMQKKNISLDQISDLIAFRVIVEQSDDCYLALGLIHKKYSAIFTRFKDYISVPKENHYQSLHTCILGPLNQKIEIQIRTKEMNEISEFGLAAHWNYKNNILTNPNQKTSYKWINSLVEILGNTTSPKDFLNQTKTEFTSDSVFCFTPNGKIISLANGATALDFAYEIHEDIGNLAAACRIDGQFKPLKTILYHGNQVEIITNNQKKPNSNWLKIVKTAKAKSYLKKYFKQQKRKEFIEIGKEHLTHHCHAANIIFDQRNFESVLDIFNKKTTDDLLEAIGYGQISSFYVMKKKYPTLNLEEKRNPFIVGVRPWSIIHYALCCHPIPGDEIIGVFSSKKNITVHQKSCSVLNNIEDKTRMKEFSWDSQQSGKFICRVFVLLDHNKGALTKLSSIISENDIDIINLKVLKRSLEEWYIALDIQVYDIKHFYTLKVSLHNLDVVRFFERFKLN